SARPSRPSSWHAPSQSAYRRRCRARKDDRSRLRGTGAVAAASGADRARFGLEFRIVNTDAVRQLRRDRGVGANIFTSFPRLIVSIDWLKDTRAQSLLDEVLAGVDHRRTPRTFDLLIVDEVHSVAPSGRGKYAVDSLRTKAIR